MLKQITTTNCLKFLQLSEKYIECIQRDITGFIMKNFTAVSQTDAFLYISQQALCKYLSGFTLQTNFQVLPMAHESLIAKT